MTLEIFYNILIVLVVVALIVFLLYKKRIPEAKRIILALIVDAENALGANTGGLKYIYVIGFVYPRLPLVVRMLVTEAKLDKWIEQGVTKLKEELAKVEEVKASIAADQALELDTTK